MNHRLDLLLGWYAALRCYFSVPFIGSGGGAQHLIGEDLAAVRNLGHSSVYAVIDSLRDRLGLYLQPSEILGSPLPSFSGLKGAYPRRMPDGFHRTVRAGEKHIHHSTDIPPK